MQVGTYPTRNFATLGPSELRPPFTGTSIQSVNLSFSSSSTGQVSDPIHHVTISQSPVFLLNSRNPLFCATFGCPKALFLPKLQSHFAEFLQPHSLIHLSLFDSFTWVGLGYGLGAFPPARPRGG